MCEIEGNSCVFLAESVPLELFLFIYILTTFK